MAEGLPRLRGFLQTEAVSAGPKKVPDDRTVSQDPRAEFINESLWHGSLDRAREILAAHPQIAGSDIHTAAILGDHEAVARFLAGNPANATVKGGPRNWDALTHLCFSRFLRLEPARTEGFLKAAMALLDAGVPMKAVVVGVACLVDDKENILIDPTADEVEVRQA